MPTHYLIVYENRSAIWAAVHFNAKTNYFQNLFYVSIWNDFFFIKYAWTSHVPKICYFFFQFLDVKNLLINN